MSESQVQQENTTNQEEKALQDMTPQELLVYAERLKKDYDKLSQKHVKYGLVWEDHDEDVVKECRENLPVLQEVTDRFVEGAIKELPKLEGKQLDAFDMANVGEVQNLADVENDIETTPTENINHILIEGDNYHALSVLNYTHKGKIDVIYIDPPYNTGNKDFKYNDAFLEKDDTWQHSKWLNFIAKRLNLAKDLLKDDGVIFISINEQEQAQLRLLCDKIFNSKNYLTMFTVKVRHEDRILKGDKDFHEVVEYLFLYRKSSNFKTVKRKFDNTSISDYIYEIKELNNSPETVMMGSKEVSVFKPSEYQIIKGNPSEDKVKSINIRGSIKEGNSSGRFFMKYLSEYLGKQLGYLYKVPNMGDDGIGFRYFLLSDKVSRLNGDYFQGVPQKRSDIKEFPYPNYLDFESDFNNVGYEGGVEFRNGKKPLNFLLKCFEMAGLQEKKNAIILDFFAGSGSTAHAIIKLNAEDGGNRQCILVTNNENNICEEVTFERCKRVIEGYTNLKGEQVQGLAGNNLRYFKTDFVPYTLNADQLRFSITGKCTEMLCLRENVFDLHMESNAYKIFKGGNKHVAIFYDMFSTELFQLRDVMNGIEGEKVLYFFSLDREPNIAEFSDWNTTKIEPIPQKILDLYKQLFRERKG